MTFAARQLHKALTITAHPSGLGQATVYVDRPLRRNLAVWRELEVKGLLRITFERDVTTPNMKYKKSFITYTLENHV